MNLSLGIVGLPNVGKSTLFNALTKQSVPAENYPFCTIDPNVGIVPVADSRFDELSEAVNPEKVTPAVVEFVDIAGIVRGAHKGEGLGNAFLANIRSVHAVVEVIRVFSDKNVTHVSEKIDPKDDKEVIEAELILKDLETVGSRIAKIEKEAKRDEKKMLELQELQAISETLDLGHLANKHITNEKNQDLINMRKQLFLLTDKPFIYLVNGDWLTIDNELVKRLREEIVIPEEYPVLPINASLEYELATMSLADREEMMKEIGIETTGLDELTRIGYRLLDLMSYFTAGVEEVRAWTVKKDSTAPQAAGQIHSDFEKKFINCEMAKVNDFISMPSWSKLREAGKVRQEGKEYIVQDGDVLLFKHGA